MLWRYAKQLPGDVRAREKEYSAVATFPGSDALPQHCNWSNLMNQLKLYVRREPTTDPVSRAIGLKRRLDVVGYADPSCKEPKARWAWFMSSCPDRRHRHAMVNCARHELNWLPGKVI